MAKKKQSEAPLAKGRGKYTAVYERDEDGVWTVEIDGLPHCHTYGDSLSRARAKIRSALGLWVDDAAKATIVDDIRIPRDVTTLVDEYRKFASALEAVQRKSSEASRAAVSRLVRDLGFSTRDASEVVGISQQRVNQLVSEPARAASARGKKSIFATGGQAKVLETFFAQIKKPSARGPSSGAWEPVVTSRPTGPRTIQGTKTSRHGAENTRR